MSTPSKAQRPANPATRRQTSPAEIFISADGRTVLHLLPTGQVLKVPSCLGRREGLAVFDGQELD